MAGPGGWLRHRWPSASTNRESRFFFFSSRRRHTRFDCDWSSDVCSSDLSLHQFQHLLVSDVAGGGDHQMVRREPLSKARAQRIAIESFHGFRGAQNRAAERMLRPEAAGKNLVK